MVIYWGNKIQSETIGSRIASVQCEKCQFHYYYLLTRVGHGSGVAPYSVGMNSATQTAQAKSLENLGERLGEEAEIVPCPKCNWINAELVEGYRRTHYQIFNGMALFVALVGTAAFLIASWYFSIGPVLDRWLVPYCLVGGPLVSIGLGLALNGVKNWLRSLIQPNRDFARTGKLPLGTPPALIRNETTGEFQLADPERLKIHTDATEVEIWVGRDSLPELCCSCLEPPTPGCEYSYPVTPTVNLPVPRCRSCQRNSDRTYFLVASTSFALGMLTLWAVLKAFPNLGSEVWIIWGAAILVHFLISCAIAGFWGAPVRATHVDADRPIATLKFRNAGFQRAVIQRLNENRSKVNLVSLPQADQDSSEMTESS